jgi:hypothetical protein
MAGRLFFVETHDGNPGALGGTGCVAVVTPLPLCTRPDRLAEFLTSASLQAMSEVGGKQKNALR